MENEEKPKFFRPQVRVELRDKIKKTARAEGQSLRDWLSDLCELYMQKVNPSGAN